ncbi:MAG: PIG-L family deacetylase [Acidobacteriota bacterium]|nr:PIG-L family deacetylase [Acidobacteriota bacterium]
MKHLADRPRRIVVRALLIVLLVGWVLPIVAQEPVAQTPSGVDKTELHQALLDLTNAATVMCVAAHPDDEDGTTLTVLRRKYGVHTVTLFSTYGEGGQNAVGPELYEALGVIRERETREAARIQGSEPHFLGLKDFGFSKSAEEAFQVWRHDEALRRLVYKIRELRPDVIITNHDTTTGHGHHQATGRLVFEAFDAAADPQRFPEQLPKVSVWQPQRLFVRTRPPGAGSTTVAPATAPAEKLVTIDPNEKNPIRGSTYAEQALAALQKHASQGPWPASIAERLRGNPTGKLQLIRYRLAREVPGAPGLSSEAKTFLDGLPVAVSAPTIDGRTLSEIIDQPDRVLNALIDWRRRTGPGVLGSDDPHRGRMMAERTDRAIAIAAGISAKVTSQGTVSVPGTLERFSINISNAGNRTVQIRKLSFEGWGKVVPLDPAELLSADSETITPLDLVTPQTAKISVPPAEHLYDDLIFGHRFVARTQLEIDGAKFSVEAEKSLGVVPAVEITNVSPSPCVKTEATLPGCDVFEVTITNHLSKPFTGFLGLTTETGRTGRDTSRKIALGPLESRTEKFSNDDPRPAREAIDDMTKSGSVLISVLSEDARQSFSARKVVVVYTDAQVVERVRVGYIPSFDQTLERSFVALGVSATRLRVEEIQDDNLKDYDTIVLDNRAYYAHPQLIGANSKLLKYVEEGGTLIVFYHKDSEWNPNPDRGRPQLAPYPIILGNERVTEEVAAVRFLQPRHALLNYPNKICRADFDNWIQERGLHYPKEWDSHYTPLFASNDKGEKPLRGGLLVARYGRGNYIYTSMVWYRQLAAGVPGAYRMLANMISYGSNSR